MIRLDTVPDALAAVGRSHSIVATAYLLQRGPMLRALEDAARRGAHVEVRVEGQPFDDSTGAMRSINAASVARLRRAGADARIVHEAGQTGPGMHMKAVVCDGVAYLDDRNFTSSGDETIVRDDSRADVDAVIAAADGKPHPSLHSFWTTKCDALAAQTRLLKSASGARTVDVETETFSFQSAAYAQLKRAAAHGVKCRLILSGRESGARALRAAQLLRRAGVEVRTANFNGKVAIVDRRRAWTGSSNATSAYLDPDQTDWAIRTHSQRVVDGLESRFEAHWRAAKPIV